MAYRRYSRRWALPRCWNIAGSCVTPAAGGWSIATASRAPAGGNMASGATPGCSTRSRASGDSLSRPRMAERSGSFRSPWNAALLRSKRCRFGNSDGCALRFPGSAGHRLRWPCSTSRPLGAWRHGKAKATESRPAGKGNRRQRRVEIRTTWRKSGGPPGWPWAQAATVRRGGEWLQSRTRRCAGSSWDVFSRSPVRRRVKWLTVDQNQPAPVSIVAVARRHHVTPSHSRGLPAAGSAVPPDRQRGIPPPALRQRAISAMIRLHGDPGQSSPPTRVRHPVDETRVPPP